MKSKSDRDRILVIRAGQLGDTVCASSIIEPLRHHFGHHVQIDWVAKAGIGQIFAEDSRITQIFELKNRRPPIPFNPPKAKIVIDSWRLPYDYIVNLELGEIFNDVVRMARADNKIGMPYRYFAEPPEAHAVENLKLIFESFLDPDDMEFAIPSLQGSDPLKVREKFNLSSDYFVLVPANSHLGKGGRVNYRAWPETHWREFLNMMSVNDLQGVIIGGEGDKTFLKQFDPLPRGIVSLAGETHFPELIGLIQGARGVVSTDTGPAHIAAAVNTPVVALIGPTNFRRTGPYRSGKNKVTILSANLSCSPCYHTDRLLNCPMNECMHAILPRHVITAMQE